MERICVYPGSFDPVTVGHMDVIERASRLFDRVIVTVFHNPAKSGCFAPADRVRMLRAACAGLENVTVDADAGLQADYVRRVGACAVVRGLRAIADFEAERALAEMNRMLLPGMETIFLMTRPEHGHISSSSVRELASFGGDVSELVPPCVAAEIQAHFSRGRKGELQNGGYSG